MSFMKHIRAPPQNEENLEEDVISDSGEETGDFKELQSPLKATVIGDSAEESKRKTITVDQSSEDQLSFSSKEGNEESNKEDDNNNNQHLKWYYHLPVLNNIDPNFEEPTGAAAGRYRGSIYSLKEKQLMIAYLVKNKKIYLCKTLEPWKQMHIDGYMRNRCIESMSINFQTIVLPNISSYGLPNSILKEFEESNTKELNTKLNTKNSSKSTTITVDQSSEDQLSFSSKEGYEESNKEDDNINNQHLKWYYRLPVLNNIDPNFEEPTRDAAADRRRGSTYSLEEKQLMIAYLVKNKKIYLCRSRRPWKQMHIDGYMRNRSIESMSNNFRKIVLPNISSYGLPNSILKEFEESNTS